MQYILTEEEYKSLLEQKEQEHEREVEQEAIQVLRNIILSDHPCIHEAGKGYCDGCKLGPLENSVSQAVQRVLCSKSKNYSK